MITYNIIGLMSGTSLDGLDIALVRLHRHENNTWTYELVQAETFSYPPEIIEKLSISTQLTAIQLFKLDKELGKNMGEFVNHFIQKNKFDKNNIDYIASHGHTVYHQPENGFTVQIGCGTTIAAISGIKVINDFRTKDVIHGGQGAPLVPIGDFELFNSEAESYLNIGGISNVSFKKNEKITAFDCSPGNLPLNKLAQNKGLSYDKDGVLAKSGEINFFLLDLLNNLPYYTQNGPKSLGTEWLESEFYPLIKFDRDIENNLRTVIEHEAIQISNILNKNELKSVFITGGGALNNFLIERIGHYFEGKIILPERKIIEFKEAIVFAFLGALYAENISNCLKDVTGADQNVCGGVLHLP
jgi:anhydro-N-acetylmuramic acid kinase